MVSAGELHVDATEEVSNKELDPAYTGSNLIGQLMITLLYQQPSLDQSDCCQYTM